MSDDDQEIEPLTEAVYKAGRAREFMIPGRGKEGGLMAFTYGDRFIKVEGMAPMTIKQALARWGDRLMGTGKV